MELALFPIQPLRKIPYPHILDNSNRGGFYAATTDKKQIEEWRTRLTGCNWAAATGKASGIFVVDIDIKNMAKGDQSFYKLLEGKPRWPRTYTVKTPSGGLHYYFNYDDRVRNLVNIGEFGGIDIKSDGGYVLVPPSRLSMGNYTVVDNVPIADAPKWLVEYLSSRPARENEDVPKEFKTNKELVPLELNTARTRAKVIYNKYIRLAAKGNRNNTCMQMCCQMRDNVVPIGVADEYVHSFVTELNQPDFSYSEAVQVLHSAYRYTPREPSFSQEEELGKINIIKKTGPASNEQYDIAEYLCKANPDIRYVEERGWLVYLPEKGYWEAEGARAYVVNYVARQLADLRGRFREAKGNPYKGSAANIKSIMELMEALCGYSINDFTPPPYLLNLQSNVIDLRTLKLYEHHRDFNFLYKCNAEYDPDADTKFAYDLLHDALKDPDEINPDGLRNLTYFIMCLGYCITGERCEECAFYIWGPPRAGKSLIVNMLYDVLGGFAGHLNMDALSTNTNDVQNFQLAGIIDKRVVVSAETDKNTRFNAAKIKTLTGGEPITCAFKYRNMFTRSEFPKMIFSSNNEIDIDANDDAIWTRWRVFEFPNSHSDDPDTTLKMRLWQARNGFLKLLCQGAEFWYAWHNSGQRLSYTQNMLQYMKGRREELDIVGTFLAEFSMTIAIPTIGGYTTAQFKPVKDLYRRFLDFCEDNKIPPYKEATFSAILKSKGFVKKTVGGKRGYLVDYVPNVNDNDIGEG